MDLIKAIVMGIIQGVAEFLPISSSGHLAIFKQILNFEDPSMLFDVMLHFGTLIAIFIAFWSDVKQLIVEGFGIIGDAFKNAFRYITSLIKREKVEYVHIIRTPYRRFVMLVIVSTIPTGLIGVLFKNQIEGFGATLLVPGICLVVTALILQVADNIRSRTRTEETASYKSAGIIGIAQGIATLPGLSRSGTTITTCLLCGFKRSFAVKYSFIMSIPAVLGATILEVKDAFSISYTAPQIFNYIIGTIIAAIVGFVCIKTMLVIVKGKKFKYFSYYCFIVGVIAIAWYFIK